MENKINSHWNERWVPIALEYPTKSKNYFVSDYGRIKSVDKVSGKERLLKPATLATGYKIFSVKYVEGRQKGYYVQKMVAENFCENPFDGEAFVIHIDQNLDNNHFENLKYVDREGLNEHYRKKGVWDPQKKKRNVAYKMTPAKVKMLKKMLKEGKTKKRILAKQFGITPEQLRKIEKGIDWAWVKLDDEDSATQPD